MVAGAGRSGTGSDPARFDRETHARIGRACGLGPAGLTERSVRVLILEDDPLIGLDLQSIVEGCGHQVIGLCESLADMRTHLGPEPAGGKPDFAFLDIDLPDGKSFDIASRLHERRIPFAFVSGSRQGDVPEHLRHARFIAKPYGHSAIRNTLRLDQRLAC